MRKLDLAGARVTEEYVHGYATAEQERLLRQAEHWRDELILAGTTLAPGTRLLEVGCGVGAVLGILGTAFPGRVLVPSGTLTAIEVDYNTIWASPTSQALKALFVTVAHAMEAAARSDAGTRLPEWLVEAGFTSVDPGEIRLAYSGEDLTRQVPYVVAVVESTLPTLAQTSGKSAPPLEAGFSELCALPTIPNAALGWVVHKAKAVR